MTGEFHLAEHPAVDRADRRQGTAAEADEETLVGHAIPDVIGIISEYR